VIPPINVLALATPALLTRTSTPPRLLLTHRNTDVTSLCCMRSAFTGYSWPAADCRDADRAWTHNWTSGYFMTLVLHTVVYLMTLSAAHTNWKRSRRKQSWPNLRCYSGICLEGLSKITKNKSGWPVSGPKFEPRTS
jgi:hypothetical protein